MAEKSFQLQQQIRSNAQELGDFLNELNKWESDIKRKDEELKRSAEIEKIVPPIRRSSRKEDKSSSQKERKVKFNEKCPSVQTSRISSYDYDAWSKFDVDAACEDVDEDDNEKSDDNTEEEEEEEDLEATLEAEEQRKLQQAEFEKDKGNFLFKDGKYEAAINRYTIAAELNPLNSIVFANRAMALIKLERYAAAEADCSRALELDPDYAKAVARRATAHAKLKKYQEAKEDQERLLELQPNNKQAKLEIAKLEKELSKVEMKNQSDNSSRRSQKQLRRIIIEDIGSDPEDEAIKAQRIEPSASLKEQTTQGENNKKKEKLETKTANKLAEPSKGKTSLNDLNPLENAKETCNVRTMPVPNTAVQFETEFKKLKKDVKLFYVYFQIIPPKSFKTLFHHCIDEVLPIALECIHKHYRRDEKEYWEELVALADVPRFEMAIMFLSKDSKRVATDLFDNLLTSDSSKNVDKETISKLAKKYSVMLAQS